MILIKNKQNIKKWPKIRYFFKDIKKSKLYKDILIKK